MSLGTGAYKVSGEANCEKYGKGGNQATLEAGTTPASSR